MKRQGIHLSTFALLLEGRGYPADPNGFHLQVLQPERMGLKLNTQQSQNCGVTFSLGLNHDILRFQEFCHGKI